MRETSYKDKGDVREKRKKKKKKRLKPPLKKKNTET